MGHACENEERVGGLMEASAHAIRGEPPCWVPVAFAGGAAAEGCSCEYLEDDVAKEVGPPVLYSPPILSDLPLGVAALHLLGRRPLMIGHDMRPDRTWGGGGGGFIMTVGTTEEQRDEGL